MFFGQGISRTFMFYGVVFILIVALVVFGGPSMGIHGVTSIVLSIGVLIFFAPVIILILVLLGMGIDFFYKKLFTRST